MAQSFADFVNTRKDQADGRDPAAPSLYAHPTDSTVQRLLSRAPLRGSIEEAINAAVRVVYGTMVHDTVQVTPRQFPEIYALLADCANRLSIPVPRLLLGATINNTWMNAFTIGNDEHCFIFMTSMLAQQLTPEELRFVIGHECGHIHNHHVSFLTLAYLTHYRVFGRFWQAPAAYKFPLLATKLPLDAWQRRAEVTADRAGAICAGDADAGARALIKLRLGYATLAKELDVEAYLDQGDLLRQETLAVRGAELTHAHPLIVKRIKMLRLFARSELFYSCAGLPRPEGADLLQRNELERQTEAIVKVL